MGKISKGILLYLLIIILYFVLVAISIYPALFFVHDRESIFVKLLPPLDLLLLRFSGKYLAKRWPNLFSNAIFAGGPRLTVGRVVAGASVSGLWVCSVVIVLMTKGLSRWQVVALLLIPFAVYLSIFDALERRWLRVDSEH